MEGWIIFSLFVRVTNLYEKKIKILGGRNETG